MLFSCTKAPLFQKSYSFKNNTWEQAVKPKFAVEIKDTTQSYDVVLTIRTTTSYAYNNIWIYLNSKTPDGKTVREPFEIKITNPDGTWTGKKSGTIVENQLLFVRRKMPQRGKYIFAVEQAVSQENLSEVLDVGMTVEQSHLN